MVVEEKLMRLANADGLGGSGRENDEENEKRTHAPHTSAGGHYFFPRLFGSAACSPATTNDITRRWRGVQFMTCRDIGE
jgi:hypothetical protein